MSSQSMPPVKQRNKKPYSAFILVTSDTCCLDESKDQSGAYVLEQLNYEDELFHRVTKRCVEDDAVKIKQSVENCIISEDPALIITIGGTGLCPRDVTPDVLSSMYDRPCNGIVTALHMTSLRYSPHAALSRLTAGIIGDCLVVNFPGSLKACKDCLSCLSVFLEHALEQIRFNAQAYNETHLKFQTHPKNPGQRPMKKSFGGSLSSIVIPEDNGEDNKSAKHSSAKFRTPNKEGPKMDQNHSVPAHKIDSKMSRISIKEIQESRAELELLANPQGANQTSSLANKKTFSHWRKFTSLDNLAIKQHPTSRAPKPAAHLSPEIIHEDDAIYPIIEFGVAHEILGSFSSELLYGHEEININSHETAFRLVGRVLSCDLKSRTLVPPYSVSTMDGYVVHIPPAFRKAVGTIKQLPPAKLLKDIIEFRAYQTHAQEAQTFFCYPINTGGKLPQKNFAVVPIENTSLLNNRGCVLIQEFKRGEYQRKPGSDLSNEDYLPNGTRIGPVELSLIISMGHKQVEVFNQLRIGVLSTGDEIVNFFAQPKLGEDQVADVNGPLLTAVFRFRGYFSFLIGIVKDQPSEILNAMKKGLKGCDVLVITGGASMGTKDHVKAVIKHMGGEIHFGRVNMKPGKPAAFASIKLDGRRKFIFSLPGNPVSAYITAMLLVLPFLEHGTRNHFNQAGTFSLNCLGGFVKVVVAEIIDDPYEFEGRLEFVRAKLISLVPEYKVVVSMKQQSSRILSLKDCDCLIMIHPTLKGKKFTLGESYPALKIDHHL